MQTDAHTDIQTEAQTHRQTHVYTHRHTEGEGEAHQVTSTPQGSSSSSTPALHPKGDSRDSRPTSLRVSSQQCGTDQCPSWSYPCHISPSPSVSVCVCV